MSEWPKTPEISQKSEESSLPGESQEFVAEKEEGIESRVLIESEEMIGRGTYGDIYRAQVLIPSKDTSGETHSKATRSKYFILKKFTRIDDPSRKLERAINIHSKLKELGVSTFTTYRILKDRGSILMSDLESEGSLTLSPSFSDASKSKNRLVHSREHKTKSLTNLESVFEKAVKETIQAAKGDITILNGDAWFYTFAPEQNSAKLERLVLGDFDNVYVGKEGKEFTLERSMVLNLFSLRSSVREMLFQVSGRINKSYEAKFDQIVLEALKEEGREDLWKKILEEHRMQQRRDQKAAEYGSFDIQNYFHEDEL